MSVLLIGLLLFATVLQLNGHDVLPTTPESSKFPDISGDFVIGELNLAKKTWYWFGEHHQLIINEVIKDIIDYSEKLTMLKFVDVDQQIPKIKLLQQRNVDAIQSVADIFNEIFLSYGAKAEVIFLKVVQGIDIARRGKSTLPNKKPCTPKVIKNMREMLHFCTWTGLGNAKEMFYDLFDNLSDGYANMIDLSRATDLNENIINKFDEATVVIENFINEYKSDMRTKLEGYYVVYINCLEGILKETNNEGLCD